MYQYAVTIWYTLPNGNRKLEKTTISYPKRIYNPNSEELIRVAANNLGLDFHRINLNHSDTRANFIGEDGDNSSSSSNSGPMGNNVSWSESGLGKLTGWAFGPKKPKKWDVDEDGNIREYDEDGNIIKNDSEDKPEEEKPEGRSIEQLKEDMMRTLGGDIFSSPAKQEDKKEMSAREKYVLDIVDENGGQLWFSDCCHALVCYKPNLNCLKCGKVCVVIDGARNIIDDDSVRDVISEL